MKTLNYKAKNLMNAEREYKLGFYQALTNLKDNLGVFSLFYMLRAGGYTEDEASDTLDEKPFDEVLMHIIDGIGDAGFLPQAAKVRMKAEMEKARKQIAGALQSNGENRD
jgi:hypothetical protein